MITATTPDNPQPEVLLIDYYHQRYKPDQPSFGKSDRTYHGAIHHFGDFLKMLPTTDPANLDRIAEFKGWMLSHRMLMLATASTYSKVVAAILRHANATEPPEPHAMLPGSIGEFLTSYAASRHDVQPATRQKIDQDCRDLICFFGPDKPLSDINHGDADAYRRHLSSLEGRGLSVNTVRRICGRAKMFFRSAARNKLIESSPFDDMRNTNVRANHARFYFVTKEEAAKVLAACPDHNWRTLFALARFGGLRNPSETLILRWSDVDFKTGRMTVRSPKTAHIEGHESRVVPIFTELRPYLLAAREADPDAEHVVNLRESSGPNPKSNLRTGLVRIILKAGLKPWPKQWQNLRASRQTELCQEFPAHVVCNWLGNSIIVAAEHYLRTVESDFAKAAGMAAPSGAKQSAMSKLRGLFGKGGDS